MSSEFLCFALWIYSAATFEFLKPACSAILYSRYGDGFDRSNEKIAPTSFGKKIAQIVRTVQTALTVLLPFLFSINLPPLKYHSAE